MTEETRLLQTPGVQPEDTLAEAGRKILRFQFAEMLRHEAGTRAGEDIEALHDMRVATRRMRAAFEVFEGSFKPKALDRHLKGLRRTGRALGHVRDLDVFMEKARRYRDGLPEDVRSGLDTLLHAWETERETARDSMLAHLDSPEYADFKANLDRFVSTPGAGVRRIDADSLPPERVRELVPILIYSRLGAVRAFAPLLDRASIEQLHALRIEFKKLRYTVEFFREVLGSESKTVINALKKVQDHLGDLNDTQVATQILSAFLGGWDPRQAQLPLAGRQSAEGVVAYLAYQHAERHRLMVTFGEVWQSFEGPDFRRSLALAVAAL